MNVVLTIIIVASLIALFAIIVTWIMTSVIGRGPVMSDLPEEEAQAKLKHNRLSVKNDEYKDIDFDVVKRGYQPHQVDDVIKYLIGELQRTRKLINPEKDNTFAGVAADLRKSTDS